MSLNFGLRCKDTDSRLWLDVGADSSVHICLTSRKYNEDTSIQIDFDDLDQGELKDLIYFLTKGLKKTQESILVTRDVA